jgi:hypothetical protein
MDGNRKGVRPGKKGCEERPSSRAAFFFIKEQLIKLDIGSSSGKRDSVLTL